MQENNESNEGATTAGTSDSTDTGSQGVDPVENSGTPGNQNGNQTDPGNDQTAKMREEIRRLNQAVVDAKRGNRKGNQETPGNENNFETPEGQYGIAIQLATGELRNKMEEVISLYSEIPADEIARIRKNPWAFAKHDSFVGGDWETAALEIEQAMLTRADEINAAKNTPAPIPANVNSNPVGETDDESVAPEDDDWNMPLDQLEAKAKKAVAKLSKSK